MCRRRGTTRCHACGCCRVVDNARVKIRLSDIVDARTAVGAAIGRDIGQGARQSGDQGIGHRHARQCLQARICDQKCVGDGLIDRVERRTACGFCNRHGRVHSRWHCRGAAGRRDHRRTAGPVMRIGRGGLIDDLACIHFGLADGCIAASTIKTVTGRECCRLRTGYARNFGVIDRNWLRWKHDVRLAGVGDRECVVQRIAQRRETRRIGDLRNRQSRRADLWNGGHVRVGRSGSVTRKSAVVHDARGHIRRRHRIDGRTVDSCTWSQRRRAAIERRADLVIRHLDLIGQRDIAVVRDSIRIGDHQSRRETGRWHVWCRLDHGQ